MQREFGRMLLVQEGGDHGIQTHGFPLSRSTCYQEVRHLAKVEDEHFVRDRLAECHRQIHVGLLVFLGSQD